MAETTELGTVEVLETEALFARLATLIEALGSSEGERAVGLPGGSTPQAWYRWVTDRRTAGERVFSQACLESVVWTTGDERFVPLADAASNFGNAERGLLNPLGVDPRMRFPWPVHLPPRVAAQQFERDWTARFGAGHGFDLCVLGMGDDAHTASLFPGSELLNARTDRLFSAVDVPDKGSRMTVTPRGLELSGRIVVAVTGEGKAEALKSVFREPRDPAARPVQALGEVAEPDRVTWLVDPAAAGDTFAG